MVESENYCINYDRDQSSVSSLYSYNNGLFYYILNLCTFLSRPAQINDHREMAVYWFPCISDNGNHDGNVFKPLSNLIFGHQLQ